MSPESILEHCTDEGVSVTVEDGKLFATGAPSALEEWRPLLRALRHELLDYLAPGGKLIELRTAHFVERGVTELTARQLAQRLHKRDDSRDERRLCLECQSLFGSAESRRCVRWAPAGLASPQLPVELPMILQRCKGFRPAQLASVRPTPLPGDVRHPSLSEC